MGALGRVKAVAVRVLLASVLLATAGTASGCGDPFRPEGLVDRLRILGVRSEPPAVGLADVASLDALALDPFGQGRQVSYTWAVCLFEISDVAEDIACPGPQAYPLPGRGPSSELSMPDLVAWALEQDFPLDPNQIPDLPDQVDSIPLIIGLQVDAGDESVRAIKRIELRLTDGGEPSTNPRLTGLELAGQAVGADPPVLHLELKKVDARPLVDEETRDWYTPTGQDDLRQEDFLFSWFSTTGEFEDRWTVLDTANDGTDLAVNEFILPKDEQELGDHKLWVVVRDGRNGVDWAEYPILIEP